MGASRKLLRGLTKVAVRDADGNITAWGDRPSPPERIAPGTPHRNVKTLDDAPVGIEHTFHATKGHRFIRIGY